MKKLLNQRYDLVKGMFTECGYNADFRVKRMLFSIFRTI